MKIKKYFLDEFVLYTLSNVCGYKRIINFVPHEVKDLEHVSDYLLLYYGK